MSGGASSSAAALGRDHVQVDVLHGVEVSDPYRWLEDGDAPEVQAWVAEQNARTRDLLDALPCRKRWIARLTQLLELPVVLAASVRDDRAILLERERGAQQARLVARRLGAPDAPPVSIADPGASVDDDAAAVDWFFASNDGSLVAFGVSEGGTEDSELRVAQVADGLLLDVSIPNCRAASVAWEPDGSGFFYTRYPDDDRYHRTVHHHTLGAASDGADDPVVWDDHPTPEAWPSIQLSPGGDRLLVSVMVGWGRTDHHLLDRTPQRWREVIVGVDAVTGFDFANDDVLAGVTTHGAPRGRVVGVDLGADAIDVGTWSTIVAERDVVLSDLSVERDGLVVRTSDNGVDALERWSLDGASHETIGGLEVGSVVQLIGDRTTGRTFAVLTGFDRPAALFSIGETAERLHPHAVDGIPDLVVDHVEYASADGTMVGLFLIHAAGVEPGSEAPTILNGYGGFAITESPVWSASIAAWCESGGLYAIAGLRGGFERGESWHHAGRREHKQNVFDDFHAAADWLVDSGWTQRDRLAIAGGSNGGLLVGAALTQRPDLCRAVWCAVPLLDMIRFPQFLIARLWTDEYGDPDVAEEFEWLMAYSPYHHLHAETVYPAVLLTTAEGDTRVDPMHARKMAARLQEVAACQERRPILLHQEGRAGHGVGKPVGKRAAEQADVLAFLSWQLGHDPVGGR